MFHSMGQRTSLKTNQRRPRETRRFYNDLPASPGLGSTVERSLPTTVRSGISPLRVDFTLLLVTIFLIVFGMLILFSASHDYSFRWYGDPFRMFTRQLLWLVLGLLVAGVLVVVDYHIWMRYVLWLMLATIAMLILVLFIGDLRNGTMRTIFGGSIQPSEAAKLTIIVYLSAWLVSKRDLLNRFWTGLAPLSAIVGTVSGLILIQPDLSAGFTIFILGIMMFFLAMRDYRQIMMMFGFALLVGFLIISLTEKGKDRMRDYINGLNDPGSASHHVQRTYGAFANGGWFGVGIDNSPSKYVSLPVPPTDSIFAVVGEETGVVGSLTVVGLFATLLWRGLAIARRAPDELGSLLAAGLSSWLALEAFINMAVVLNILPFAGNALPFFSAGGSNLVVSLAAIGILLNISRSSKQRETREGKLIYAVANMRWWDRRRGLSSPRRSASRTR